MVADVSQLDILKHQQIKLNLLDTFMGNEAFRKFNQEDWLYLHAYFIIYTLHLPLCQFLLPTQSADWGRSLFQLSEN